MRHFVTFECFFGEGDWRGQWGGGLMAVFAANNFKWLDTSTVEQLTHRLVSHTNTPQLASRLGSIQHDDI